MSPKLNKPDISESKAELEDYVAGLLFDRPASIENFDKQDEAKVVKFAKEVTRATSVVPLKPAENNTIEKALSAQNAIDGNEKPDNDLVVEHIKQVITEPLESEPETQHERELEREPGLEPEPEIEATLSIKDEVPSDSSPSSHFEQGNNRQHSLKIKQEIQAYSKRIFKEADEPDPRLKGVEKLLAKIALAKVVIPQPETTNQNKELAQQAAISESEGLTNADIDLESASSSFSLRESQPLKDVLGNVFQTLIFEVNKLPLAVPLVKLGGIVNISSEDITPLVGTPDWFLGLVPHEKGNLMVVDTNQFIMPEQKANSEREYEYLIILDDSNWALACHSVGEAKNLTPDDIRWSARSSKRPWFAGMVVEFMSALVEVDELINMLTDNIVE